MTAKKDFLKVGWKLKMWEVELPWTLLICSDDWKARCLLMCGMAFRTVVLQSSLIAYFPYSLLPSSPVC